MKGPVLAAAVTMCTAALAADDTTCDNGIVTATGGTVDLHTEICTASDTALALFAKCGMSLSNNVTVKVTDRVLEGCFGVFHCGESVIEVLSPDAMVGLRDPDAIFAGLPPTVLFQSVVVHELTHALLDGTPCPRDNCLATNEYLAYSLQIASLSEAHRTLVTQALSVDEPILPDEINAFIYMMNPSLFAMKSWVHYSQQSDRCSMMRRIADGSVRFDRTPE